MKRITSGFTLIELMIVVAIIAIIAAIAIPNLLAARLSANETSAVANMRTISSAQGQFQIAAKADVDGDGTGEYGMFRELCAAAPVRTTALGTSTGSALRTPILSAAFRSLSSAGRVHQSGYAYRLWLHGTNGSAIGEGSLTLLQGGGGSIDTEMSETTWCVYAAPLGYARSGNRTFFINQAGDVSTTESSAYSPTSYPHAGAAFFGTGNLHGISGRQAIGTVARDGNYWKQVN